MSAPDRIVSLAPSNTEILYALGVDDRVVATTAVCDHPSGVQDTPGVGGWTNPDVEAVAAHDPDLVLASDALQDDAVAACKDAELPVKQVRPQRLHEAFNSIKQIGEWVGAEDAALELVEELNAGVQEHSVNQVAERPRVYCEEWGDPPMAGGNWIPDMLRMVGAEPLLEPGERSREVDSAELQRFDPDYIVLHYCGYGEDADPGTLQQRDGWSDLAAVEQGHVHVVPDAVLNRPGPRLVDGMQRLRDIVRD